MVLLGFGVAAVEAGDPLGVLHHGVLGHEHLLGCLLLQLVQLAGHPPLHGVQQNQRLTSSGSCQELCLRGNALTPYSKVHHRSQHHLGSLNHELM